MSWHTNSIGDLAVRDLEKFAAESNRADKEVDVINKQKELIECVLKTIPADSIAIVEASGHIDSYSSHTKLETRIFKR